VPCTMIDSSFLYQYFKLFDFIEVKVKKQYDFLSLQKELNSDCLGKWSIHLPKRMLYDESEFNTAMQILECINNCKVYPLNVVTHFYGYESEMISKLRKLRKKIPKEVEICLENIQTYNTKYIDELEYVIHRLEKENISICIDLGHLMYGGMKLGYTQIELIKMLKSKRSICKNVKEIHIHDFNLQTDHITLSKGKLDRLMLCELFQFLPIVPIIIETNVRKADEDGLMQVSWVKEILNYEDSEN